MADQPRGRSAADTKKSNTKKGRKKKRLTLRRLLTVLFFAAAAGIICGIIGYLLIILNGERILAENQNKLVLPETSVVYDANGNEIATLFHENRENASFDEIPELLKQAVIATEDRRFEEHSGIDVWAIGRALVKDILAREMVEGGSTITQQLAKNLFLSSDKTILRKATEASIAVALENQLTKDEILEMYLNRIFSANANTASKRPRNIISAKNWMSWSCGKSPRLPAFRRLHRATTRSAIRSCPRNGGRSSCS
ncbi:hypothetical protein PACILC2_14900 [Paenibacillus cisolokensis]|uniref:Glycosyl transferase family 51 domain-containing protein n=1 Tax=Paenibacillus cisolokensis TaxID=1658519 RepID=A0ABQ4N429_9BACL|nr:hypothetical protein PACILC2_14900 [Paenibacillus cisolokensis]